MLEKIGFILMLIGCAGIDSGNIWLAAFLIVVGLAIVSVTAWKEKSLTHTDQSKT